jgi:hypothetical protein
LQTPLRPSIGPPAPLAPIPPLQTIARPFVAPLMAEGLPVETYVSAFLQPFGATMETPALWRDASGHALVVSQQLFRDGRGRLKLPFEARERHVLRLAEALADPDEIWLDWIEGANGATRLARRYLRTSPESPEFVSFVWSKDEWSGATAFNPATGRKLRGNPDYLEKQRSGALLYRRPAGPGRDSGGDGS